MMNPSATPLLAGLLGLMAVGCAPANITSAKWDGSPLTASTQTRCERVDLRDTKDMTTLFAKYDGWKLVYISEYTTPNRFGTDSAVCFERH